MTTRILAAISFCSFCIAIATVCDAQKKDPLTPAPRPLTQPARYEREAPAQDENHFAFSLEKEGLILIRDFRKFEDGKKIWEVITLDTALQVTWATRLATEADHLLIGYEYKPGAFHLFFRKERFEQLHGIVAKIDLAAHTFTTLPFKIELGFKLTHFTVAGDNSIFGGYIGSEPAIAMLDALSQRTKVIPGFFLTNAELLDLRPNRNNTFSAIQLQKKNGQDVVVYGAYDRNGSLLIEDRFPIRDGYTILSATASSVQQDEVLVAGTFTYGNSKQAAGLFHVRVNPFDESEPEFTDFPLLEHFLDQQTVKRAVQQKEKTKQRVAYGRASDFRTNAIVRRIDEHPGGFYIFGESWSQSTNPNNQNNPTAFYPGYYRPVGFGYPYYMPGYWGPSRFGFDPFNPGQPNLQEYRMVNTFVIACDTRGKVIWDQSADLKETRVYSTDQFSDYSVSGGNVEFIFPSEKGISFSQGSLTPMEAGLLKTSPGKKIFTAALNVRTGTESREDDSTDNSIRHWYGNTFFTFGLQDIGEGKDRKRVFFVNKIKLPL